jgi:hypothetical protein
MGNKNRIKHQNFDAKLTYRGTFQNLQNNPAHEQQGRQTHLRKKVEKDKNKAMRKNKEKETEYEPENDKERTPLGVPKRT